MEKNKSKNFWESLTAATQENSCCSVPTKEVTKEDTAGTKQEASGSNSDENKLSQSGCCG
ncbi:hypothetical protein [Dysgonomonas sp. ZJ709]|uniref:hypothetical protein n=1 Tax=Dysgonomonas sp. ZJ709 TaxID=2709797 RepID=UPI0013ED3C1C|nr:hypothetical protein [Dysgonomonas sp. ZJ709]